MASTAPEDLYGKFELPLNLFATQGFISNDDYPSSSSDNSYLLYYIGMRDDIARPVASFVSLSDSESKNEDKTEHVLTNDCVKLTYEIWIGDSGASSHMATTTNGMFDMKDCQILVRFGNKSELFATKVGKFRGIAVSKNGKRHLFCFTMSSTYQDYTAICLASARQ